MTAPYTLTTDQAVALQKIVTAPQENRRSAVQAYRRKKGTAATIDLFAEFVGLAHSVTNNTREWLEMAAIVFGDLHPYQAEQLNTPTLAGACAGAILAQGVDDRSRCGGCAFRVGTPANQSLPTVADAFQGTQGEHAFLCHETGDGQPKTACRGYAQAIQRQKEVSP